MNLVERNRNIIDFTLSSLLRRKRKNIALILVYVFIVFAQGSVVFFAQAMKEEASVTLEAAPEMVVQRSVAGRQSLFPTDYVERIAAAEGVASARGRLWGYYFDPGSGANYTVLVPRTCGFKPGEIAIGRGISRNRMAWEGDSLSLRAYDGEPLLFKIRGILYPGSELVASDLVLLCEDDFRRLFDVPDGHATDAVLELKEGADPGAVASEILRTLPDTKPIPRGAVLRTYDAAFSRSGGMVLLVLFGTSLAFLFLAWDKATGPSAEERRKIGVLKGIGWDTSDVLLMKFWESAVISLSSFCAGILLAYAHVFLASACLFEPALKGWSTLYPHFKPVPFIDFQSVAALFCITVLPYAAATLIPAWKAARIDPDLVMR